MFVFVVYSYFILAKVVKIASLTLSIDCDMARLLFKAPVCFEFVGRSQHAYGLKAQQSVDSSRV